MPTRRPGPRASLLLGLVASACTRAPASVGSHEARVIGGVRDPEALGFPISVLERNAAVGQLATVDGVAYQGCSGTLIGDRAVLSASHCVVLNQAEWVDGAPPELVPPEALAYAVGEDVTAPDCLLQAEQVILHPGALPSDLGIAHDLSITILTESATASCPGVVPVSVTREPTSEALLGDFFLQGGFGSTDGTYDFSPIRYWSRMELHRIDGMFLTMIDAEQGFPTFGDSGSGALYRTEDGRLWDHGVASAGGGTSLMFVELGVETEFLDSVIDDTLRCGPIDEVGECRGGSIVRCDAMGFSSTDCEARGASCVVGDDGPACEGLAPDAGVDAGAPDASADAGDRDASVDAGGPAGGGGAGGAGCSCSVAPRPGSTGAWPGLGLGLGLPALLCAVAARRRARRRVGALLVALSGALAACPARHEPPREPPAPRPEPAAAPSPAPPAAPPTGPATPAPAPAAGAVAPVLPAGDAGAPDLAALRALLARHGTLRFDAAAQERGCPADQTLGEYVALLARYGEQGDGPSDVHRLAGACLAAPAPAERMAIDPPLDPAYWFCRLDAFTSDPAGESPWHYELRLRVKRSDRAPDLATLACPGTP